MTGSIRAKTAGALKWSVPLPRFVIQTFAGAILIIVGIGFLVVGLFTGGTCGAHYLLTAGLSVVLIGGGAAFATISPRIGIFCFILGLGLIGIALAIAPGGACTPV